MSVVTQKGSGLTPSKVLSKYTFKNYMKHSQEANLCTDHMGTMVLTNPQREFLVIEFIKHIALYFLP